MLQKAASVEEVVSAMESESGAGGQIFSLGATYDAINGFSAVLNGPAMTRLLDVFAGSLEHVECDSTMEAFAASTLYCDDQTVRSPDT
jgi:hypothetical protein